MKKRLLPSMFLIWPLLAGCATSQAITGPDGREVWHIDCSGMYLSWGSCLEKAGKLCGTSGYTLLFSNKEDGYAASAGQFGTFSSNLMKREMFIRCSPE